MREEERIQRWSILTALENFFYGEMRDGGCWRGGEIERERFENVQKDLIEKGNFSIKKERKDKGQNSETVVESGLREQRQLE